MKASLKIAGGAELREGTQDLYLSTWVRKQRDSRLAEAEAAIQQLREAHTPPRKPRISGQYSLTQRYFEKQNQTMKLLVKAAPKKCFQDCRL